jgi:hypothetical protein
MISRLVQIPSNKIESYIALLVFLFFIISICFAHILFNYSVCKGAAVRIGNQVRLCCHSDEPMENAINYGDK